MIALNDDDGKTILVNPRYLVSAIMAENDPGEWIVMIDMRSEADMIEAVFKSEKGAREAMAAIGREL